jgi:Tol biopolymer transport system component
MEPNGRVHWTLARSGPVAAPTWSYEGFRIAYLAGHALRIVNGDGTGDHLLAPNAVGTGLPAFGWRPGTHQLAFRNANDELMLADVDRGRLLWRRRAPGVERLQWSADGRRLLVSGGRSHVLDPSGRTIAALPSGLQLPAAFAPRSHALAAVTTAQGRSTVVVRSGPGYRNHRSLFSGPGTFGGVAWSPNGRWLLVDWRTADQWVFIPTTRGRRVVTAAHVGPIFDSGPEHYATLAGWCCP